MKNITLALLVAISLIVTSSARAQSTTGITTDPLPFDSVKVYMDRGWISFEFDDRSYIVDLGPISGPHPHNRTFGDIVGFYQLDDRSAQEFMLQRIILHGNATDHARWGPFTKRDPRLEEVVPFRFVEMPTMKRFRLVRTP